MRGSTVLIMGFTVINSDTHARHALIKIINYH